MKFISACFFNTFLSIAVLLALFMTIYWFRLSLEPGLEMYKLDFFLGLYLTSVLTISALREATRMFRD